MSVKFRDRDESWFYRFDLRGVRYQEYGFASKKEAGDAERTKIKEIQQGQKPAARAVRDVTFAQAAKAFYDNYASTLDSEENYRSRLPVICSAPSMKKKVLDLCRQDIRDLRTYLKATVKTTKLVDGAPTEVPVSIRTVNHYHAHVKAVVSWWLKENELTAANAAELVEMERVPKERVRFLYPAEEKILTPAARQHAWLWPYYFAAIETGIRQANLCAIRVKDVEFTLGHIFLPDTKNGDSGIVPFSDRLAPWLKAWARGKGSADLLLGDYVANTVSHEFSALCASVGVKDFTFHDLRHTFATYHLLRGESVEHVSKLLLQKDPRVTQEHYNGVLAVHLRKVLNRGASVVSGLEALDGGEDFSATPKDTPITGLGVADMMESLELQ